MTTDTDEKFDSVVRAESFEPIQWDALLLFFLICFIDTRRLYVI